MNTAKNHEWMRIGELCEMLQISRSKAYDLLGEDNCIKSVRLGENRGSVRINRPSVEKYVAERMTTTH